MDSKELRKETKKKLKALGKRNRKFIKVECISCHKIDRIRVNNPELYTEEVQKKYKCFLCSIK